MSFTIIKISADDPADNVRIDNIITLALRDFDYRLINGINELISAELRGQRLLFVVALGKFGINPAYSRVLSLLRGNTSLLEDCTSAILVDGDSELYTKSTGTELAFALNSAGSALVGRPLVEGTGSLFNFRVQAKLIGVDCRGAYLAAVRDLAERLENSYFPKQEKPKILALHASSHRTSNTMQLWQQVCERLGDSCEINEIGLRNGTISDCSGCPYTMCIHFGEKGRCFYGGMMQEEVWPAVLKADALMMLCPNYNDALSANLTAFINRLTGLFRQKRFYDKAVFAIIVSGYSGGDILARQVISALNMNKSFFLPPRFALLETANDPGEALRLPGIEGRLNNFTENIIQTLSFE
ncbi:MAG: NAD(P)H-dependent oxidoreductase [Anaerolineaceae bacterium]|nr:NAD(P)H-dependent oxidoreductase [Anaerolineaceae bacterium]